jgi:hypothetical protein
MWQQQTIISLQRLRISRWRHGPSKVMLLIIVIGSELVTFLLAQRML